MLEITQITRRNSLTPLSLFLAFFSVQFSAALQLSPEYVLNWEYDQPQETIYFEAVVATKGFVGLGLSPTGGMTGADIVVGGVADDGTPYFLDYHGIGPQAPVPDSSQDWFLTQALENETHTTLQFWRKLKTCDEDDWEINLDTQKLIWSWGSTDNLAYHGTARGTKLRNLLDPPINPPDLSQFKVWNIFNTITVPAYHTTYWCSIHKTPNFTEPHHMVAFDIHLPNDVALRHTHHVDVYVCRPREMDADQLFGKWLGHVGRDCYEPDPNIPDFPADYCDVIELGWVIGGEITMFPPHTGFPFYPNSYYMLEIHYDNPSSLPNLTYETGHSIYYTEKLRENDAGYLLVGSVVNFTEMVPPNSERFTQVAHCSPSCTGNWGDDGLNVFAFLFHAHTSAKEMKVRLFRDGVEMPWLLYDAHFDFNYQQNRMLRQEFKLWPGDHLTVECTYDTTWKNGETTIGGRSTREEMCMAYFFYYPNDPRIVMCNSEVPAPQLLKYLGIQGIETEGEWTLDPIVTAPEQYAGLPFTMVVESLNWTQGMREEYQKFHKYTSHEVECYPLTDQRTLTTYPSFNDWQPIDTCEAD